MTTYAHVRDGIAVNVTTTDPKRLFTPDLAAKFSVVSDDTVEGSRVEPVEPVEPEIQPPAKKKK